MGNTNSRLFLLAEKMEPEAPEKGGFRLRPPKTMAQAPTELKYKTTGVFTGKKIAIHLVNKVVNQSTPSLGVIRLDGFV